MATEFANLNPSLDLLDRLVDIQTTDGVIKEPIRLAKAFLKLERRFMLVTRPDIPEPSEVSLIDRAISNTERGENITSQELLFHYANMTEGDVVTRQDVVTCQDEIHARRAQALRKLALALPVQLGSQSR